MPNSSSIQIIPKIPGLVARIDKSKGAWRALGTLAPDRLSALRRVATIESIGSSTRIEDSRMSDREVERLLSNLQLKGFGIRNEQEIAGSAEVMELVFASWQEITLTENHVRQLHRDLLVHSEKDRWHPLFTYRMPSELASGCGSVWWAKLIPVCLCKWQLSGAEIRRS